MIVPVREAKTHGVMWGCGLTSLVVWIKNDRTCDIRERNVTTRSEICTENICSLGFGDIIRGWVTLWRSKLRSLVASLIWDGPLDILFGLSTVNGEFMGWLGILPLFPHMIRWFSMLIRLVPKLINLIRWKPNVFLACRSFTLRFSKQSVTKLIWGVATMTF